MEVRRLTREEKLRPLGSGLSEEAKAFLRRAGATSFYGRRDQEDDYAELNQDGVKIDRAWLEADPPAKR